MAATTVVIFFSLSPLAFALPPFPTLRDKVHRFNCSVHCETSSRAALCAQPSSLFVFVILSLSLSLCLCLTLVCVHSSVCLTPRLTSLFLHVFQKAVEEEESQVRKSPAELCPPSGKLNDGDPARKVSRPDPPTCPAPPSSRISTTSYCCTLHTLPPFLPSPSVTQRSAVRVTTDIHTPLFVHSEWHTSPL